MVKRQVIKIDEDLCTGCEECIPNCPEGAIQIVAGKARIISDLFCDGLGACLGHCPVDAISIEEREAEEYDERKVMANVVKQGKDVVKAHLLHMKDHGQTEYLNQAIDYLKENNMEVPVLEEESSPEPKAEHHHGHGEGTLPCGCPGSAVMDLRAEGEACVEEVKTISSGVSRLQQWPVQIMLVPPTAPYLKGADLLIAADCVPFAYPDFHENLLKGKILLVGCPKLDDANHYVEKITHMLKENDIKSLTVAHMEVPCCFGLIKIIQEAMKASGKDIPYKETVIGVKGDIKDEK
jgi:ferredoxin